MRYFIYLISLLILTGIDQYSKYYIVNNFTLNNRLRIIDGFFNISYVKNYGAGFSIMQNQRLFLISISSLAIIFLAYLIIKNKKDHFSNFCYLLIMAGALGNLIDRVRLGYVVDFLDFIIFKYDFPVFNVADSLITIGCILLIIVSLWGEKHAKS